MSWSACQPSCYTKYWWPTVMSCKTLMANHHVKQDIGGQTSYWTWHRWPTVILHVYKTCMLGINGQLSCHARHWWPTVMFCKALVASHHVNKTLVANRHVLQGIGGQPSCHARHLWPTVILYKTLMANHHVIQDIDGQPSCHARHWLPSYIRHRYSTITLYNLIS